VVMRQKTTEPIEMSFGFWGRMCARNYELDAVLRDVDMTTIFGFWWGITLVYDS